MKSTDDLTTTELMDMIKNNLREVNSLEKSDRNLPIALKRLDVTARGAATALSLAEFQVRRDKAGNTSRVLIEATQIPKKLLK